MTALSLIQRAGTYGSAPALFCGGSSYCYADILQASARIAGALLRGASDLREQRVAFVAPSGFEYAAVQWAVWRAGGIATPLSVSAAAPEIEHVLTNAKASVVVTLQPLLGDIESLCLKMGVPVLLVKDALLAPPAKLPHVSPDRRAMILYTSGTTSKPKGVVTTHANIEAQVTTLIDAWGWRRDDRVPLFLPLHHIHGIINVLTCALWSGATIDIFPSFDLNGILARVAEKAYTLFMAVPTIYVKLIQSLESATPEQAERMAEGFRSMRLMISGSAALPASVHARWTELTGQRLLERYGMTEIGMAISNPLQGERRPGAVGRPLPGVAVRLKSESGTTVTRENEPGEIQVKGPSVFCEYWNNPSVTSESFDGGWFKTGDMAVVENGYYRILGRLSVDIIKSGGYKLSALEIEDVLRMHPAIKECAVVGVEDELWGEAVAAAVVTKEGEDLDLAALRAWAGDRLSKYKLPKQWTVVPALPRNAMGKVTKPAVRALFPQQ